MACRLAFVALLATAALASGCGGAAAQIPESASLAPADAVVFARITTDDDSSQWQKAERVLERIPGVRDTLVSAIEQRLSDEGLDWETDVAPALGDEVVVVATAKLRPIVLLQPDSEEKLAALLAKSDEAPARGEVDGWVALAEKDTDLADYRAALERGTIEGDEAFAAGLEALPDESLGLVWVDMAVLTDELSPVFQQATQEKIDLGIDWLSACALCGGRRDARRDGGAHARRKRHALRADALPPRARRRRRRRLLRRNPGHARPAPGAGRRRRPVADDRRRDRCVARRHRRRALRRGRALRPSRARRFPRSRSRSRRPIRTRRGTTVDRLARKLARRCKRP